jgi:hypothetical protein
VGTKGDRRVGKGPARGGGVTHEVFGGFGGRVVGSLTKLRDGFTLWSMGKVTMKSRAVLLVDNEKTRPKEFTSGSTF